MCEVTTIGTAFLVGASTKLGEHAMEYAIKNRDKAKKLMEDCDQEIQSGWERDREAGGVSSWGKESKTATA
ncbi:hypothetical protein [Umezakia ovalisporum]|uniref:Uncharacterized protein n=1 Tax=Umezakia ovalisporum FSS-62 TaxID=2971776 RepID=A0AA43H1E5_9CYAN|nr:hypothetical protein [Umezakia ovalisporum]MDH6065416.1 hypothetical protein [Umezakia ovalisporum FSS-62]